MMYMGMADVSGAYATFIARPLTATRTASSSSSRRTSAGRRARRAPRRTPRRFSRRTTSRRSRTSRIARWRTTSPAIAWGISFYDLLSATATSRTNSNSGPIPGVHEGGERSARGRGIHPHRQLCRGSGEDRSHARRERRIARAVGRRHDRHAAGAGRSECVPQVPTGNGTVACGNIMEAMKYEKRIETTYSGFGRFWIDGRGWGDLVTARRSSSRFLIRKCSRDRSRSICSAPGSAARPPKEFTDSDAADCRFSRACRPWCRWRWRGATRMRRSIRRRRRLRADMSSSASLTAVASG